MNAIETITQNQKRIRTNIIKKQINRLITVKGNLNKNRKSKFEHLTKLACRFINNFDNPTYCNATEEKVFSAMQEGRCY